MWQNIAGMFGLGGQPSWNEKFYEILKTGKTTRIKEDLKDAKQKAGEAIDDLKDASIAAKDIAKETIVDIAGTASEVAGNIKEGAKEKIATAADNLKASATGAADTVKNVAGTASHAAGEVVTGAADYVKETATEAAETVKEYA